MSSIAALLATPDSTAYGGSKAAVRHVPLGDFPLPEDIVAAVAFLCSDDARFITGAEIVVDGGVVHCDTFEPRR
jgi:NAD(P)-dependent dehydrogenase (short-subunit alcohol dehydrogenase family)